MSRKLKSLMGPFLARHPEIQLEVDANSNRADLQRAEADQAVRIGPVEGQGIALLPDFYARGLPPVGNAVLSRLLYLTLHEDKARVSPVRLNSLRKC